MFFEDGSTSVILKRWTTRIFSNEVPIFIFMLLLLGTKSREEVNETHLDEMGQARFRSAFENVPLKKKNCLT